MFPTQSKCNETIAKALSVYRKGREATQELFGASKNFSCENIRFFQNVSKMTARSKFEQEFINDQSEINALLHAIEPGDIHSSEFYDQKRIRYRIEPFASGTNLKTWLRNESSLGPFISERLLRLVQCVDNLEANNRINTLSYKELCKSMSKHRHLLSSLKTAIKNRNTSYATELANMTEIFESAISNWQTLAEQELGSSVCESIKKEARIKYQDDKKCLVFYNKRLREEIENRIDKINSELERAKYKKEEENSRETTQDKIIQTTPEMVHHLDENYSIDSDDDGPPSYHSSSNNECTFSS